jgi:phosphoenolpyruvate synthase/pyruvate phosphate dikinase
VNNAYVIGLDQIGKNDTMIAGGKGANLGEIIRMNNVNRLMGGLFEAATNQLFNG